MAYDKGLAERIREQLKGNIYITEKKMFGGLCFLHDGNMLCGIVKDELMLRTGPDLYATLLTKPHAREMDFTGRPMKGMLIVETQGFSEDTDLKWWLDQVLVFVSGLPPK
ncbi:TfoX N-terminal domain-containing protein [Oceanospirillum multiglobuliferum]|uniref:RNA methyltransferase n=1 Tax=Oceanospirillum multiglobuliferum TaxID=64969 RepID=A0A1T4KST7_9GAMM|nr:TfoX/Sxy family protein [Oceanospirillum multiglobuliferum]OPX56134.1 RNA methyltransferase [Oceanospirillum multiglobuliferum]SJZ45443.1 TfoX N-terminal domain-containing protein [Oceanospirillum multiglobuliferum]